MLTTFQQFIKKEKLFSTDDTILLTVSGGIDSVALCDLFYQSDYKFAIAHCNFHLRGTDSDDDELFVSELAKHYTVPFHCTHFNTQEYAKENGISIQMAARDLRYAWFNELLQTYSYAYAATGHHRDDNIETFFINLLRGTGIRGLRGMLLKQNRFIHPLLFAGRNEITEFCKSNNLSYREDISNADTKYERNKIRHELIPLLHELSKNFDTVMVKNLERLRETESAMRLAIENIKKDILSEKEGVSFISIQKLKQLEPTKFYLFEILNEFGFNESVVSDIVESLDSISGKQFFSPSHKLIKDREDLILISLKKDVDEQRDFLIHKNENEIATPISLSLKILSYNSKLLFKPSKNIAYLDYDKIRFPLQLRKWEKGDYFFPIGLKGKKKISDFFADLKLSLWEKENIFLLCSEKNIVWVVGERIDNRYRIDKSTKHVLQITYR